MAAPMPRSKTWHGSVQQLAAAPPQAPAKAASASGGASATATAALLASAADSSDPLRRFAALCVAVRQADAQEAAAAAAARGGRTHRAATLPPLFLESLEGSSRGGDAPAGAGIKRPHAAAAPSGQHGGVAKRARTSGVERGQRCGGGGVTSSMVVVEGVPVPAPSMRTSSFGALLSRWEQQAPVAAAARAAAAPSNAAQAASPRRDAALGASATGLEALMRSDTQLQRILGSLPGVERPPSWLGHSTAAGGSGPGRLPSWLQDGHASGSEGASRRPSSSAAPASPLQAVDLDELAAELRAQIKPAPLPAAPPAPATPRLQPPPPAAAPVQLLALAAPACAQLSGGPAAAQPPLAPPGAALGRQLLPAAAPPLTLAAAPAGALLITPPLHPSLTAQGQQQGLAGGDVERVAGLLLGLQAMQPAVARQFRQHLAPELLLRVLQVQADMMARMRVADAVPAPEAAPLQSAGQLPVPPTPAAPAPRRMWPAAAGAAARAGFGGAWGRAAGGPEQAQGSSVPIRQASAAGSSEQQPTRGWPAAEWIRVVGCSYPELQQAAGQGRPSVGARLVAGHGAARGVGAGGGPLLQAGGPGTMLGPSVGAPAAPCGDGGATVY